MAAVGAALLLITRTVDPHHVYEEVDWGCSYSSLAFSSLPAARSARVRSRALGRSRSGQRLPGDPWKATSRTRVTA